MCGAYRSLFSNPEINAPAEWTAFVDKSFEDDVTVGLVELAVNRIINLTRKKVLDFPDSKAGDLADIFFKELRVIQSRFL